MTRARLREAYGVDFPDELFEIWDWRSGLTGEALHAFKNVLGLSLHGPFDVLAGKLEGPLRYSPLLHWRYQYDPPELFTVMTGDTDGLHWGYWFDDPGRLPPVVASFYARDAFELVESASLADAIGKHVERAREGIAENRKRDPDHESSYDRDDRALDALDKKRPLHRRQPDRGPIASTRGGIGIVCARAQLAAWTLPATVEPAAILAHADAEIAAGRPGTALYMGHMLWDPHRLLALDVLARAYAALDREPLRAVAAMHRAHPKVPSLDITTYKPGDFTDLADALAHPSEVRKLTTREPLPADADLSVLVELRELEIPWCGLTDLPVSLARCANLARVHLFNNKLTALPAALAELPALAELELGKNAITSLAGIERCTSLRKLGLQGNRLTELPAGFDALASLEELDLGNNPLARLPDSLAGLGKLRRVVLAGTMLLAADYDRLRAAVPTVEIVGTPSAAATPYSIKAAYKVGDMLAHPTFGIGRVARVDGNQISVDFSDTLRKLAHKR